MTKVDMRRIVDYEPLDHDDKFVWHVAMAISEAYRDHYCDTVGMVASIEMARAALKAIVDSAA